MSARDSSTDHPASPVGGDLVKRHRLSTRIWHWSNVVVLLVMLMSGLMIFNAHPRLYWGSYGANPDYAWLEIGGRTTDQGDQGFLRIGDATFITTGVLGLSQRADGRANPVAFPSWATIPSKYDLALSRRWHLSFAWLFAASILIYGAFSLVNGHIRRDLLPSRGQLRPRHIWSDIKHHAMLKFPTGEAALHYNILQKGAYLLVLGLLIPGMVVTGLTMSPSMNATWPFLLDLFGGRQTARSLHFLFATGLVGFILVHLVMVLLAGPFNEIRSMITGRFRLPKEKT